MREDVGELGSCLCTPSTSTVGPGALGLAALPSGWDHARDRGDLSIQVCPGSRAGRPDPGSLAQRDRGRPSSWGRLEPGRVACKPFPGLERAWGLPGAPRTSPSRALRGRQSRGLSALPDAWRVLSPASAKELPSPMESARVENQASLVSPEPRGRLPQWTGPTGGALQGEPGQVALPTSCVNRVSHQTPSAGFKTDDHQSRQS